MPRTARIYLDDGVFHILCRGNNKQNVFLADSDFAVYKSIIQRLRKDHPLKVFHYCLMANHVHLIIESGPNTDLSRFMKRLNLTYCGYFKKKYGYFGHFWQDRFKSLLISKDEYLTACGLYIERNPVKAMIAESPKFYRHSSYNYYAYGYKDDILDRSPLYDSLDSNEEKRRKAYRDLLLDKELGIDEGVFKQLFLGSQDFIGAMEKQFNVQNTRPSVGRPQRN